MGKRAFEDPSETGVNLAGPLDQALRRHAVERADYFFYYLFALQVLVKRLNGASGTKFKATDALSVIATQQIGTGFRRTGQGYLTFDKTKADIVTLNASSFGRTDAAHFCNLGIAPKFVQSMESYITSQHAQKDPVPLRFYEMVKKICGDTEQLPQQINIGPDRVIDILHGNLAEEFLSIDKPVVTRKRVGIYRDAAVARMTQYRDECAQYDEFGLAACSDAYLAAYNDVGVLSRQAKRDIYIKHQQASLEAMRLGKQAPPSPNVMNKEFVDTIYGRVSRAVTLECMAFDSLNVNDYVD